MGKNAQKRAARQVRFLLKQGIDINPATAAVFNPAPASSPPPAPEPPAPTPPTPPAPIKPPVQAPATLAATGAGVGKSKKKVEKRRLSDLRIKRKKKPEGEVVGSPTGTGLNTPKV